MQQTFGDALRELRMRQGLSVRGLAHALGTSRSYIRELERGESRPSPARVQQLAGILDANPDYLALISGRIPEDLLRALQTNPALIDLVRTSLHT